MVDTNLKIIGELKHFLDIISDTPALNEICFESKRDFTRKRKLDFHGTMCLIVNMLKRSLKIELQDFFEYGLCRKTKYTKMAFSLQRRKIKPLVFELWNELLVACFYEYYGKRVKKWRNFLLIAIDGSTSYLFDKKDIKENFGTQTNQHMEVPMARVMKFYDVLNKLTIYSKILPIRKSEQAILAGNIERLPINSLSIYDRGFPSYLLMYLLINQESMRHFVMRCKVDFNKEVKYFVAGKKMDSTIKLYPGAEAIKNLFHQGYVVTKHTAITIRMVKVVLKTGEIEVLLTNLFDNDQFKTRDFKDLYFQRWPIETSFAVDKNTLQMEQFSGHSAKTIEQDFYAMTFISNLQSLIENQCEPSINAKNRVRKLNYKINKNVSIGSMKHKVVQLFVAGEPKKILLELQELFLESLEPIRPGRSSPRVFKIRKTKGKYKTVTNYKRAV